ncbi:early boundary activity protein 1-like [Trichomycterus rosablanca]|uniref:early boundary activity protein 1-like n=1 Tax=Trichomycterus rosablanca TaxID=2290929 RepID=UPI002F35A9F9
MAYMLIQWIEDPPTWDVLPIKKIANGICSVGSICDVFYGDETSPAKILQKGSRSALLKILETLEKRENSAKDTEICGRGQRQKWPPIRLSPATTSEDEEEFLPTNTVRKEKKKEMARTMSKSILMDYKVNQKSSSCVSDSAGPCSPSAFGDSGSQAHNTKVVIKQLSELKEILMGMKEKIENIEKRIIRVESKALPHETEKVLPPPDNNKKMQTHETVTTLPTQVKIGPNTAITSEQYANVKWTDPKKSTKDLLLAVFGRRKLATHTYTGKCSNAFRGREAKPQLDPDKVCDIINYIRKKFGTDIRLIKQAISQKCADECKMATRKM